VTAGHQDFTCYFGGDTFLSIRGILASGLHETAKDSLRVIGGIAERQDGKAPHEFSSTGNVYDPGSVGETPLFMRVVWDTYLWTGDENFLKELYPTLKKGMWDYIESEPVANGVLMGEIEDHPGGAREKINPIQLAGGYKIFADMCERLGDIEDAKRARAESDRYLKQVEELFWVEEEGSYTDIIDENNKPLIDKNNLMWGRPFQGVGYIGISPKERVVRSLAKFKGPKYESEYGVFLGGNNCNMPVQTGFAAIAEFNYDRNEEGLEYVRCLARTCGHASPGAFPEGMDPYGDRKKMRYFKSSHWNYLQLWSSAFMPESLVWGLLKLRPDAANRKITLKPWLPENWPFMEFRNIRIGQSRFNVRVDKSGTKVTQVDGPKLEVNIIE
jgi:glycogen debranching enzyme